VWGEHFIFVVDGHLVMLLRRWDYEHFYMAWQYSPSISIKGQKNC
jgi:hypothetical protein